MSGHKFLSVSEAADFLNGTCEDVIRWVMEDRTLTALLVSDHGSATQFKLGALSQYGVSDTGAVTDRFHESRSVGSLRFEFAEVVRHLAEWSKEVAAAVPLTEFLSEMPSEATSDSASWAVKRPERFRGYSVPLYRFLAGAHREGKPRPSARDVIEEWQVKQPAEIAQVLPDGVNYYDSRGNTKAADLEAIRKAIERMTSGR